MPKLNIRNIRRLADHIEGLPAGRFNQSAWGTYMVRSLVRRKYQPDLPVYGHETSACIAGWAAMLFRSGELVAETLKWGEPMSIPRLAADALGLPQPPGGGRRDDGPAGRLFDPDDCPELSAITTTDAVRVLRHLADTGEVDWSLIDEYEDKFE